ncbi:hypothetical protein BK133_11315 [Paenibacillus sp. FSL H8-0548]|uniref:hypothetical protein n=1 Tax=Paenibacillus sp. FSL H8-0548 TaxID=1920422 RepID=UPI00096DA95E|nr:hypothetical protein [Paenibacillus sp. FSL H8-0548]OMF35284.1 hypothetical protein BK133_11315 [Paenibacillus sp. FSL H8-0548]
MTSSNASNASLGYFRFLTTFTNAMMLRANAAPITIHVITFIAIPPFILIMLYVKIGWRDRGSDLSEEPYLRLRRLRGVPFFLSFAANPTSIVAVTSWMIAVRSPTQSFIFSPFPKASPSLSILIIYEYRYFVNDIRNIIYVIR